jgi:hypothetical protein
MLHNSTTFGRVPIEVGLKENNAIRNREGSMTMKSQNTIFFNKNKRFYTNKTACYSPTPTTSQDFNQLNMIKEKNNKGNKILKNRLLSQSRLLSHDNFLLKSSFDGSIQNQW